MRRLLFIFGMLVTLAAGVPARAASNSANTENLRVQLVFPETQLAPGASAQAGLYFKLEPGWHVYWKNAGDAGEPPKIQWTLPAGITATALEFPAPSRVPLGPLMDYGYEHEVLFPFAVHVGTSAKAGPAVLHAHVHWLVCRDVCIPGNADLEQNVIIAKESGVAPVSPFDRGLINQARQQLPTALPPADKAIFQYTGAGLRLQVDTGKRETQAVFFPADQDVVDNPAPQKVTPTTTGLILDLQKDSSLTAAPARLSGVLELSGGRNYEITAQPARMITATSAELPGRAPAGALARIVGFALLGGVLLNLMPCVFPVLFIKGLALVQSGREERNKLRAHGLVYTAGIVVSFWLLVAALLGLRAAGSTLGWGFQFQSPIFLTLMAGLLFFLGLSLAGQFEIGLSLTGTGGGLAAKQGYAGSFFTGVLAVVVATPCTAPFMGVAIGYALAQPAAITFAVFTALALGLAAPYLALTLQPAWTRLLPKPGAWMEILRQAVSVPVFATVIWLAWVLAQAYGAAALAALLSVFLLLAIAGWFLGRWPAKRWSTVAAVVIWASVVGVAYFVPSLARAATGSASAQSAGATASAWQPWTPGAVQRSLAAGEPVFVDFTASWCLSCQVNERVALSEPEVLQDFKAHRVVLFKADWTRQDPAITKTLAALGRSGVPVYALYLPGEDSPRLLPQVLTPGIVTEALDQIPAAGAQSAGALGN